MWITWPSTWAPSQYPKRRLFVRSRKVSKPRDWYFKLSYRFEIWQAHQQHCCRSACQFSEGSDNSKYKSRGFETLRDLTERRLFGYWDGTQRLRVASLVMCYIFGYSHTKNTNKCQACFMYASYIKVCFKLRDVESNTMWILLISEWFLYSMYILKCSIKTRKTVLLKMQWKPVTPNLNLLPNSQLCLEKNELSIVRQCIGFFLITYNNHYEARDAITLSKCYYRQLETRSGDFRSIAIGLTRGYLHWDSLSHI